MIRLSELTPRFLNSIEKGTCFDLYRPKYSTVQKTGQMLKQMVHRATGTKSPLFKITPIENGYKITCIAVKKVAPYKIPVVNKESSGLFIKKIVAAEVLELLNELDPLLVDEIGNSNETRIRFEYPTKGNAKLAAAIKRFIYSIPQKSSMAIVKVFAYEDNGTTKFVIKRRKRIQIF